jgi:hypothetical protein
MAEKPQSGGVAIACATVAIVMLFSGLVYVSCEEHSGPPSTATPAAGAPPPTTSVPTRSPPPTFYLTPVPLAPESTALPPHPRPAGERWP